MNSGNLRHRLVIQRKQYTRNSIGEESVIWVDEASVWGKVEPIISRTKEFLAMQQVQSDTTHTVKVRFRNALNHDKRFMFNGRVLKIQRVVDPYESHEWLVCFCEENAL